MDGNTLQTRKLHIIDDGTDMHFCLTYDVASDWFMICDWQTRTGWTFAGRLKWYTIPSTWKESECYMKSAHSHGSIAFHDFGATAKALVVYLLTFYKKNGTLSGLPADINVSPIRTGLLGIFDRMVD